MSHQLLNGGYHNDYLYGGPGNDTLRGEHGHDTLFAETGNDRLYGGDGDDILVGYSSQSSYIEWDELWGGAGYDRFVLGDSSRAFYEGGWAGIKDWDYLRDFIQVHGSVNQYNLQYQNYYGTSALDTGIYYNNNSHNLIGIVIDSTNVNLHRDFVFK